MSDVAYDYTGVDGMSRFRVIRSEPGKRFRIETPDGDPLPDPIPNDLAVLYRLPALAASPPGATVYIAEGEKDVDALVQLGLVATSNPCGTRMGWRDQYTHHLADRHVVLMPDGDGPGRRHAERVQQSVKPVALSVITVALYDHGPFDVSDWLARPGHSVQQLQRKVRQERLSRAGIFREWPTKSDREMLLWTADLTPTAKLVLAYLASIWADVTGRAEGRSQPPTAGQVAAACGIHRVTAQRTLTALRRSGHVAADRDGSWIAWDVLALIQRPSA